MTMHPAARMAENGSRHWGNEGWLPVPGLVGGLAGGLLTSGMMLAGELRDGAPSDLTRLERRTAQRLGLPHRGVDADATAGEQVVGHAGHLALSALAGAAYGAICNPHRSTIAQGAAFGLGFYALAYGVIGPALGVVKAPWQDTPASVAQRAGIHALFGVVTAVVAGRVAGRRS